MLSNVPTKLELLNAVKSLENNEALRATHSKSGTNHILTLNVSALPTTIFKIYFAATAAWEEDDTISLQDGSGNTLVSPTIKTQANADLPDAAFASGATIELICNNGGSEAKLFFRVSGSSGGGGGGFPSADDVTITYTGAENTRRYITDGNGKKYLLLELTSSGTLSVDKDVVCDICLVGGGNNGVTNRQSSWFNGQGGAGGYLYNYFLIGLKSDDDAAIEVGAPNGYKSTFTRSKLKLTMNNLDTSASEASKGGTGGGYCSSGGTGDGLSKYVFLDNSVYSYPICAGGAGGGYIYYGEYYKGGSGGTNGGNGTAIEQVASVDLYTESEGGYNGGGHGGLGYATDDARNTKGADGTTYGSGGGGGGSWYTNYYTASGHGKQGVVFIRIPV